MVRQIGKTLIIAGVGPFSVGLHCSLIHNDGQFFLLLVTFMPDIKLNAFEWCRLKFLILISYFLNYVSRHQF